MGVSEEHLWGAKRGDAEIGGVANEGGYEVQVQGSWGRVGRDGGGVQTFLQVAEMGGVDTGEAGVADKGEGVVRERFVDVM